MFFNDVWLTFISFTYKSESENIILVLPNENLQQPRRKSLFCPKVQINQRWRTRRNGHDVICTTSTSCKKIIPGIECAICVEYCLGAPYRPLPGFLRWVARYFWSDDDTLFQFDVQKVVINGEA